MEIPPRPWYALPRFFRDPITSGSIVAYGIQFPSLTINACSTTCLFFHDCSLVNKHLTHVMQQYFVYTRTAIWKMCDKVKSQNNRG